CRLHGTLPALTFGAVRYFAIASESQSRLRNAMQYESRSANVPAGIRGYALRMRRKTAIRRPKS
ncbi:hypothetical protein, partial [Escherichia coli]|uniref:hypothetical protein n=1 Tax=Escherichia coli TaxID=562 RepID=UPI0039E0AD99